MSHLHSRAYGWHSLISHVFIFLYLTPPPHFYKETCIILHVQFGISPSCNNAMLIPMSALSVKFSYVATNIVSLWMCFFIIRGNMSTFLCCNKYWITLYMYIFFTNIESPFICIFSFNQEMWSKTVFKFWKH